MFGVSLLDLILLYATMNRPYGTSKLGNVRPPPIDEDQDLSALDKR